MPDLIHSLQDRDLGHLRIVAALWGLELGPTETSEALKELCARLLDPQRVGEIVDGLPPEAASALEALAAEGGRIPWAAFARRFGEIREVGAGRRDREQIHLNPISVAEMLFYRALLGRAFFDAPAGPQEFAFIPDDLIPLIPREERRDGEKQNVSGSSASISSPKAAAVNPASEPLGRLATPIERANPLPTDDRILDDACSLLSALRLGWTSLPNPETLSVPENILREFLQAAGLVEASAPLPEPARNFLACSRGEALALLVRTWLNSESFNELRQLPGLVCEGEWTNQPLSTRRLLLDLLSAIPHGQWWSLNAFVRMVKEKHADFQRPAGDYDSWFIRRSSDGTYLRGFPSWDEVDGALIRYLIIGPLHWLGVLDLAVPGPDKDPSAFRFTASASRLLEGLAPKEFLEENARLHVSSQGRIVVPRFLPRLARYQIARFCDWEEGRKDEYRYRVTPASLKRAVEQGVKVEQLLGLLQKHTAAPVPPAFVRSILRWEKHGAEAHLEAQVILRLGSPEVLEELRRSSAGRFLGEALGPVTVIVKAGAQARVLAALAEMGLLAEDNTTREISNE